jgi:23S rRNA pseudouridine2605 synthase
MAPENRSKKPTGKKTSGKSTSGKDKKTESGKSESGEMEFDGNVFDETDEDFVNEGNTREAGAEDGNVDENYVKGNENNDAGEGNAGEGSDTAEEGEAEDKLTRLNKFISNAGVTARRKADDLIFTGRVTVNMKTVTEPGTRVDPDKDVVKVDGEKVKPQSEYIYVVLFKPRGYVTTTSDDKGRPTVMDLIGLNTRLYPIGRLDYDTDGVLLLTNDGEFSNMMMHPRHKIFKTYFAKLDKPIEEHDARKLKEGVIIDGRPTSRAKVRIIPNTGEQNIWISIHEGRNRQVRRMLEALGYIVQRLKRVEYARIGLDDLKPGDWRYMTPEEVDAARKLATPKPVQVRREPVVKPEDGAPVQQVKVTGKKGGKKKKKLKKLEKMQQKMAVKQQQSGSQQSNSQQQNMQQPAQQKVQPSTGSDVLDSISKELEEIKEQISDTSQDVKSE